MELWMWAVLVVVGVAVVTGLIAGVQARRRRGRVIVVRRGGRGSRRMS
ncbi:hypothetical protein ABT039_07690 [Streptomyces lasiicapitis]